jgi:hypothetical protein
MNQTLNELVIELHDIAREYSDIRLRKIADEVSNIASEYKLTELNDPDRLEFERKRNYPYD